MLNSLLSCVALDWPPPLNAVTPVAADRVIRPLRVRLANLAELAVAISAARWTALARGDIIAKKRRPLRSVGMSMMAGGPHHKR